ncbi:MAG: hypothetical protein AB7M93_04040 [Candidatus Obscuribacterales bacterium]
MSTWREIVSSVSNNPGTVPGLEPVELVADESKPVARDSETGVRETPALVRNEPEPGRIVPAGLTEFENVTEGAAVLSILYGLSISTEK